MKVFLYENCFTFVLMKKYSAILFLILYLTTTTELCQLLKIPLLTQHFTEHHFYNNNLTFLEFLSNHYSQEDDNDGDKEKDSKLPFKSHSFCNDTVNIVLLNNVENLFLFTLQKIKIPKSISSFYNLCFSSSFSNAIWQPPQFC